MSFRMRNREVIDVDSIPGLDKDRPVDLTALSDDDDIVPLGTYIPPNRMSMGANRHRRGCPNGPMSSIQVTFTDTSRSIKQRSDKRPVPPDVHRLPPPKRQRTDNAHEHGRSVPMKKSPANDLGVIDFLESDDDDDDEYESFHAGYDMGNSANWAPVKYNESKLDFDAPDNDASYLQHSPPRSQRRLPDFSIGTLFDHTGPCHPQLIWETLRSSGVFRSAPKPCAWALPSTLYSRSRCHRPNALSLNMSFKKAPGGINKIIQSGPYIGIASAATGGDRDEETGETVDPYNREGAAMVWNGTLHQLEAHKGHLDNAVKQYTVNDVKFDTLNQRLVTTGRDRGLEVWNYWAQNTEKPTLYQSWHYPAVPNEIAFKPGTSVYAVAEHIVHVYSSTDADATEEDLRVAPKKRRCKDLVGAITWGRGPTANKLFASTEPLPGQNGGWHKGFDVTVGQAVMTMDNEEAGDAMAMTDSGDTLALFTCTGHLNKLRLYDIRNSQSKAYSQIMLEPFSFSIESGGLQEVPSAAFRDDGIYLAFGRNDNHTHVYDTRMLHRLLFDYVHDGPFKNSPGSLSYGITAIKWVDQFTSSLSSGLVTGGSDGCVRLWDPLKSDQNEGNGVVIAETNSDIGYFSIGDRFNREQELVVGDCAGEVYFFGMSQNNA